MSWTNLIGFSNWERGIFVILWRSVFLAKFSILNQSAMAMVAQANQAQSAVLAVLQ